MDDDPYSSPRQSSAPGAGSRRTRWQIVPTLLCTVLGAAVLLIGIANAALHWQLLLRENWRMSVFLMQFSTACMWLSAARMWWKDFKKVQRDRIDGGRAHMRTCCLFHPSGSVKLAACSEGALIVPRGAPRRVAGSSTRRRVGGCFWLDRCSLAWPITRGAPLRDDPGLWSLTPSASGALRGSFSAAGWRNKEHPAAQLGYSSKSAAGGRDEGLYEYQFRGAPRQGRGGGSRYPPPNRGLAPSG